MAISDVIQSVFVSTFINHVTASTPFVSVVQDRSSDILNGGDSLIVPKSTGLVSVSDYTDDDDVVYSTLSPEKIEFSLDKRKYIAFQFEYEDAAQVSADVWGQAISESAQTFASQLTADFRSLYSDATVNATHLHEVTVNGDGSVTAAHREELVFDFYDMVAQLREDGHEVSPVVFVPSAMHRELVRFFTIDKPQSVPAYTAGVFADARLSGFFGCDIIPDWGDTTAISSTPDTVGPQAHAVIPRRTIGYAQQLSRVEQLTSATRFARLWRALQTYGMGVQDSATLHRIQIKTPV